ncbi:MAG: hypothetical protein ABSD50_17125, partial [Smithella sp.]
VRLLRPECTTNDNYNTLTRVVAQARLTACPQISLSGIAPDFGTDSVAKIEQSHRLLQCVSGGQVDH